MLPPRGAVVGEVPIEILHLEQREPAANPAKYFAHTF
jgi:hypothetical protein